MLTFFLFLCRKTTFPVNVGVVWMFVFSDMFVYVLTSFSSLDWLIFICHFCERVGDLPGGRWMGRKKMMQTPLSNISRSEMLASAVSKSTNLLCQINIDKVVVTQL